MTLHAFDQLWVYLSGAPLLYLLVTLLAFWLATVLNKRFGGTPFLHPVLVAIVLIICFLLITHTTYATYFDGAQFIHFLLGPATVALAVPLYDHLARVRSMLIPLGLACVGGIIISAFMTLGLATAMGAPHQLLVTLAPKSVTSPIAMGIADQLGGIPSLAAGLVLITGAIGAATGPVVFRLLKIRDHTVQGFTMGLSAHGFGTAHCFSSISALAGAFAGLAMGLTGLLTAILLPLLVKLFGL
ncbi:LrgB family protein [Phytohalomonas tamaricis]|uniref:LrgB family protein n=1 Tax=Phytohalomonas tamaricis TaxID=2081032 RepID=UPI000D0B9594|nr:LrgB family protein [Phytohalomonas tamaricis]